MLPIAAVDEPQRRAFFCWPEEVDTIALARAISEVEMIGIPATHLGRAPFPAGDDVGASSHGNAVVETAVTAFLAHAAPVRRVERRTHAQISYLGRSAFHFAGKCFTGLPAIEKRNDKEKHKWHLIRNWCGRRRAPSSINSIQAKSRRSTCLTCWSGGSPRSMAR